MVPHVLDIIDEVDVVCSTWFKMASGPATSRGQTTGRMGYPRELPHKKLVEGGVPAQENGALRSRENDRRVVQPQRNFDICRAGN
jgi:hypothetical protein